MDRLAYNFCTGIHNLGLVKDAERLINNFLDEDSIVYAQNPDGSYVKLQKGVKFIAATELGVKED